MKKDDDKMQRQERSTFLRFFSLATNFVYTLAAPVVLLLVIYYLLIHYHVMKHRPLVLLLFVVFGIITGYWQLYQEIKNKEK